MCTSICRSIIVAQFCEKGSLGIGMRTDVVFIVADVVDAGSHGPLLIEPVIYSCVSDEIAADPAIDIVIEVRIVEETIGSRGIAQPGRQGQPVVWTISGDGARPPCRDARPISPDDERILEIREDAGAGQCHGRRKVEARNPYILRLERGFYAVKAHFAD